jgi:hypothetical protein
MNVDETGWLGERNTHQDGEKCIPHFSQNILRGDPLGRPKVRWKDKRVIRVGLRDTGCEFNRDRIGCNTDSCGTR